MLETQTRKQKQPLTRKTRLKAEQLLRNYTEDWRSYAQKGEQVYIIDDESFCKIRESISKGTKCCLSNINYCILIKNNNNQVDRYSQPMLVEGLSTDPTAPTNRIRVVSLELNFLIFNELACSGYPIKRTIVQLIDSKSIELYPKFIDFEVLSATRLKNMPKTTNSSNRSSIEPSQKYKIRYRQKQKGSQIYQSIRNLICRNVSIKGSWLKIYLYNPNLFKRIKFQRKLSYYMEGEDMKYAATAEQQKLYRLIDNKNFDEFIVQFFPGKLINKQEEIVLKYTDRLVVELLEDSKWVFPEQPGFSIAKKCDFCDLLTQLYLRFKCNKCLKELNFCTRVCHYEGLIGHACSEGKETLAQYYGSEDIQLQKPIKKIQRKKTGHSDDKSSSSQQPNNNNILADIDLTQKKTESHTSSQNVNNSSTQPLSSNSTENKQSTVKEPIKKPVVPPPPPSVQKVSTTAQSKTSNNLNNSILTNWTGGIANLGNTCYMNASLQAIARTDLTKIILNMKEFIKIPMTKAYSGLLKHLQISNYYSPVGMYDIQIFKNVIDSELAQFYGYHQQDAHQFLMTFIDKIHDQLNRNAKGVHYDFPSLPNHSFSNEQILARQQWIYYISNHNSPITDMFYGQQMETTECPHCHNKSIKFAPFSSIACSILPIPQYRTICLFYQEMKYTQKPFRTQALAKNKVSHLLNLLKSRFKINAQSEKKLKLFVTGFQGLCREIDVDGQLANIYTPSKAGQREEQLYAFQYLDQPNTTMVFKIINQNKSFSFKRPFFFKQHFDQLTNKILYQAVSEYFKNFLKCNTKSDPDAFKLFSQESAQDIQFFFTLSLHINGNPDIQGKILFKKSIQLASTDTRLVDAAQIDKSNINQVWIKLKTPAKKNVYSRQDKVLHKFYDLIMDKFNKYMPDNQSPMGEQSIIKLQDCLKQEYNKKTALDQKNLWHCRICNQKRKAHLSSSLYTVGRYLIINIKRFKRNMTGEIYQKNRAKVRPPLQLNLEGLLLKPKLPQTYYSQLTSEEKRRLRVQKAELDQTSSFSFTLKGIIFHDGDIERGHYIAMVQQGQQWIQFNDQNSQVIDIQKRLNENLHKVYVLIYERVKNPK